jgi:hypothetical protein
MATLVMAAVIKNNGLGTGGINFDAKIRYTYLHSCHGLVFAACWVVLLGMIVRSWLHLRAVQPIDSRFLPVCRLTLSAAQMLEYAIP